jgi:hypothetical protein
MPIRQAVKANAKTKVRKPLRFHQREIERAIRGIKKMGLPVGRVDVDPTTGRISIVTADQTNTDQQNPWDEDLKDAANKKRAT